MKVQEQDQYHGIALTQIVEHKSFKALNRASSKYGHYLVNTDRHVFLKYRTPVMSPWIFTLQADELKAIAAEVQVNQKVFLALVCGTITVCALDIDEVKELVDLSIKLGQQSIRVEVPQGGSCHVSGSAGSLKYTIPHNSFPNKVFE